MNEDIRWWDAAQLVGMKRKGSQRHDPEARYHQKDRTHCCTPNPGPPAEQPSCPQGACCWLQLNLCSHGPSPPTHCAACCTCLPFRLQPFAHCRLPPGLRDRITIWSATLDRHSSLFPFFQPITCDNICWYIMQGNLIAKVLLELCTSAVKKNRVPLKWLSSSSGTSSKPVGIPVGISLAKYPLVLCA